MAHAVSLKTAHDERLGAEMAHARSLSQPLSEAESLNKALEEHTKAMQAAAANVAGVVARAKAERVALSASVVVGVYGGQKADREPRARERLSGRPAGGASQRGIVVQAALEHAVGESRTALIATESGGVPSRRALLL